MKALLFFAVLFLLSCSSHKDTKNRRTQSEIPIEEYPDFNHGRFAHINFESTRDEVVFVSINFFKGADQSASRVVKTIEDLMKNHYQELTLDEIEKILRKYNSPIYLVARPMTKIKEPGFTSLRRWDLKSSKMFYKYYLWVALNGQEEVVKELELKSYDDFDVEGNLEKLKFDTGVLYPIKKYKES